MNQSFNVLWPDWEVVELIGSGNFGVVYKIRRCVSEEEETAAVKMISIPREDGNIKEMLNEGYDEESITAIYKDHLQSIISEYSLMKKLSECPNIVNCDDVKSIQHDNGIGWDVYIKMELLTPLADALPEKITEEITLKLAKDICNALVVCNQNDVLHRDIKPQNIFMSANGDYKLGDFGISKIAQKTSYGTHVGTPKYMAPEVYNNQPYGIAADIYSLGLVLYWMLNERRMPFLPISRKITMAMDEDARVRRLSGEKIPAPANGSDELKRIVLKACACNPQDRYKLPQQMLTALNNIGKKEEPKANYDLHYTLMLTEQELVSGCTKNAYGENGKVYSVRIPPNAKHNDVLRLKGAGKLDSLTGEKGDLYVTLQAFVSDNSQFDIKHTIYLTQTEMNNGCEKEMEVLLLGDKVKVHVPKGVKVGDSLTLKGKGLQNPATGERGNLILIVVLKKSTSAPFIYDKSRYKNEDWSKVVDEHLLEYINKKKTGGFLKFTRRVIIPMLLFSVLVTLYGMLAYIAPVPILIVLAILVLAVPVIVACSPDYIEKNREAAKKEWNKRHPNNKKF